MISKLEHNQVFVFGSNTNGYHNGGAAKQALEWGAIYGIGFGRHGQTYAIPTLGADMSRLPLCAIKHYLSRLAEDAAREPDTDFLLTKVGQGIAGFTATEIESIMPKFPRNVIRV